MYLALRSSANSMDFSKILHSILKTSVWAYNLMVNNVVRSNYIFVENDKIEILFSNYILGLTFQSPSSWRWNLESKSEYIVRK